MPLLSDEARNLALDSCYGDDRGPGWPGTVVARLFTDDPRDGGLELPAGGGYAAVTVPNTSVVFPAAVGGVKTVEVDFGTTTGAWADVATWAVLCHPTTGAWLDGVGLAEDVNVTAAGFGVAVVLEITYDEQTV